LAGSVHFLCEAAPLAYIMEQANGQAVTSDGRRVLGKTKVDENISFGYL
jgi:fructose-1,6-bisphosphatase